MGSSDSKLRKECFNEIKFVLNSFHKKYESFNKIPRYGMDQINKKLSDNKKSTWIHIDEFFNVFRQWRNDALFVKSITIFKTVEDRDNSVFDSFVNDTFDLENKIKQILMKKNISDKKQYMNQV